jgi:hypothetical protein
MDVTEIQTRLDKLVKAMLAKGMREPDASATVQAHASPYVGLRRKSKSEATYGDTASEYFTTETIEEGFTKAEAWIEARPSPEQAKLNEFMAAVAAAADMGRELGIDAEFVNPLTVMMKKLSENALTFQSKK